jgi:hypothetical protein
VQIKKEPTSDTKEAKLDQMNTECWLNLNFFLTSCRSGAVVDLTVDQDKDLEEDIELLLAVQAMEEDL